MSKVQIGFINFLGNVEGPLTVYGQRNMSVFREALGVYWLRVGPTPLNGANLPVAAADNAFQRDRGEMMPHITFESVTVPTSYALSKQADNVTWLLRTFSTPAFTPADLITYFEVESFYSFNAA